MYAPGATFYRYACALSSDLVMYMSLVDTLVLFAQPRTFLLFLSCTLRSLACRITYLCTYEENARDAYSFPISVDQPTRQYRHHHPHPMDRFGRRGQEPSSHPQDRGLSRNQNQQKLPPFRDVSYHLPPQSRLC
jgi:hypothetical protein